MNLVAKMAPVGPQLKIGVWIVPVLLDIIHSRPSGLHVCIYFFPVACAELLECDVAYRHGVADHPFDLASFCIHRSHCLCTVPIAVGLLGR